MMLVPLTSWGGGVIHGYISGRMVALIWGNSSLVINLDFY